MVSVIIPCHNHHDTLNRAVISAWAAGAKEVIVVDDGSDEPLQKGAYTLLKTGVRGMPAGVCHARNVGVAYTPENALILPVDADDELAEGSIKTLTEAYRENTFVYGGHYEHTEYRPPSPIGMIDRKDVTGVTFLFSKADWKRSGGYHPNFNVGCEGWALMASMLQCGMQAIRIGAPIYHYYPTAEGRRARCRERMSVIMQMLHEQYPVVFHAKQDGTRQGAAIRTA